ncbi:MAG: T9SS C-terminal target domain-containing protein [Calditrichaeota bacterium]|nr:MAG: T9SS C-terminal target domain-containing protein [Calditrichota bacterium]MBL1207634.1 T9SS C-terminal target domain-containing protein [Calditrichota bacterium]NOG47467.1 T9SS type A sorting domain-containing protein [Calditrichota bacterium]
MKFLLTILLFLISTKIYSQVDTSIYYPLHIGDTWEYYNPYSGYYQVEIIGDTLMPNDRTYFEFSMTNRKYQRVDSNRYVMVYNEFAQDKEFIQYDLLAKKGEIIISPINETYGNGVYDSGIDNNNLLQQNLKWKEYRDVFIDTTINPPDTVWNQTVDLYWPRITKGLGVSTYSAGLEILVGATINGVGYGTLVGIEENKKTVNNSFYLSQNYPNPFNPSTTIKYNLPIKSHIIINIYNAAGEKVELLFEGTQKGGKHDITFDGSDLSSGIYFIRLRAGNYTQSIKALLLK